MGNTRRGRWVCRRLPPPGTGATEDGPRLVLTSKGAADAIYFENAHALRQPGGALLTLRNGMAVVPRYDYPRKIRSGATSSWVSAHATWPCAFGWTGSSSYACTTSACSTSRGGNTRSGTISVS